MIIRPEIVADYAAIARVTNRAFEDRWFEPSIVAFARQRLSFDPELSLIAEMDGQVVGHVLFMPYTVRLMGADVPAVCLAPIAIEPAHQRQSIGGKLIAEGHRIAREKGYAFSFLLGHTEYYPRFGYRMGAFGVSSIEVQTEPAHAIIESRPPLEEDIPALTALWRHEEGGVDFALLPEATLLEWKSPNPAVEARVYLRDGEIVGYARVHSARPAQPQVFYAANSESARAVAASLVTSGGTVTLPLHPYSASAGAFGSPSAEAWDAGMVCPLQTGVLDVYFSELSSGKRTAGRVLWPTDFDLE